MDSVRTQALREVHLPQKFVEFNTVRGGSQKTFPIRKIIDTKPYTMIN